MSLQKGNVKQHIKSVHRLAGKGVEEGVEDRFEEIRHEYVAMAQHLFGQRRVRCAASATSTDTL